VRHPGARRFPRSSAVDVDVLVPGKVFQLLGKMIGLNAN
jgi:hypothetical protein